MEYKELEEKLKEYFKGDVEEFAYITKENNLCNLGKVVEVDTTGGMDEGSFWSSTKHFIDHDIYIRVVGHYQSHHGTDFDSWGSYSVHQVKPVKKEIIDYEKVQN